MKKVTAIVTAVTFILTLIITGCSTETEHASADSVSASETSTVSERSVFSVSESETSSAMIPDSESSAASFSSEDNETGEETIPYVDIIIFAGQSNMAGRGETCEQWPETAPEITDGAGFEFRAISDPTTLYPVEEPFGVNENNPDGIYDVYKNGTNRKTGSLVTSFINEYYEVTGTPVIAVSASQGHTSTRYWIPSSDSGFMDDLYSRFTKCQNYIENNTDYVIRHKYIVWCQGEDDGENIANGTEVLEEYKINLPTIIDTFMDMGFEKVFMVRIGRYNGEDSTRYDDIIQYQTEFAEESEDVIMVSTDFADMRDMGLMKDEYHFYQTAYNTVGTNAGRNAGLYVNETEGSHM